MSRKAKGARPVYFENPENDKLLAMLMAVVGEVSVLRERLDTFERIAASKNLVLREEVERFEPDEKAAEQREQWRREYIDRVLRIVRQDLESQAAGETQGTYRQALELVNG